MLISICEEQILKTLNNLFLVDSGSKSNAGFLKNLIALRIFHPEGPVRTDPHFRISSQVLRRAQQPS